MEEEKELLLVNGAFICTIFLNRRDLENLGVKFTEWSNDLITIDETILVSYVS